MASILGSINLLVLFVEPCSKEKDLEPQNPTNNDSDVQQNEIIAKLSGKDPIEDGYKLETRYLEVDKEKVRTYLKELIRFLSLEVMEHNYETTSSEKGINIYTTLSATTNSNEYIIIGAHYDSGYESPGANDNATGVALIYELMKKLKNLATRNKNLMFVFFDDEEMGLIGSNEFAKKITIEGLNVHSVHTVDQMGWDNDGDKAIELELPTDFLKEKYQSAAASNNIPIHVTPVNSTDHHSFRIQGFNAVGLTEEFLNGDTTPHYHTSGDTYETINFDYLLSSTELMYTVISNIISD